MTQDQFVDLMRHGTTELRCFDCGKRAEGPGDDPAALAQDLVTHMMSAHGMTEEEAKNHQVNVGVHVYRCPRCQCRYPHDGDIEALSRADNKTRICNKCATDEAFESIAGRLTPVHEWPKDSGIFPRPVTGWVGQGGWEKERSSNRAARTPIPTPRELPDLRLHLMERWIPGGIFETALKKVRFGGSGYAPFPRGGAAGWATNLAAAEREALRQASLWWIKDEMVELTIAAAKSIPHDIYASEVKLPADKEFGIALLGAPYVGRDAATPGDEVEVNCIVWGKSDIVTETSKVVECLSVSMYAYLDFSGGLSKRQLGMAVESGAVWDAAAEMVGNSPLGAVGHIRGGAWVYKGRTDWPLVDSLVSFQGFGDEETDFAMTNQRRASMIEDRKFLAALSLLVNHKLSSADMIWSDRQARRRSARAGVDENKEPSHVRYIRLREIRKKEGETDEEHEKRHVEWTHRWVVNGHVAWRRCGPKGSQRRLSYIPAYVKGPSDKPLVIKEEVRVWTR